MGEAGWSVWSISSVWLVSFLEPEKPDQQEEPDRPDKPDRLGPFTSPRTSSNLVQGGFEIVGDGGRREKTPDPFAFPVKHAAPLHDKCAFTDCAKRKDSRALLIRPL
jgi:hypothetical protein